MVALLTTISGAFSSSSSCSMQTPPVSIQSAVASYATSQRHQCFSTSKFCTARTTQFSPLSTPLGSQYSGHLVMVVQRSHKSSSDLVAETDVFLLFQEMGFNDKETELLLKTNEATISTSFESLRARILSLRALGIDGLALGRLIKKRPDVLTAAEIDLFLQFVRDDLEGGIEAAKLQKLLTATEPRFLVGFDRKVKLLLHHGIPQERISHVLNNVNLNKAFCLRSAEDIDTAITFLSGFGSVELIVRRPAILNYDLQSQLIPRIEFLTKLSGGDKDATGTVLRKLPAVLSYSVEHMEGQVELLRSFAGLTDQEIFRIVLVFPNVISVSRTRKLHPRIDFLKQCGLNSEDIFKFLIKAPLFLALSFEGNLAHKLSFLVKIGYQYRTKDLVMAMRAVTRTSCANLQKVIGLFLSYGLSYQDIVVMSKKHPQILQYNHSSLEEKMEYLIEEMGREVGELLAFPAFLGYKLDDRIKPRYEVKKKIIGDGMSINKLLSVSADSFMKKRENPLI